ncbi:MAG: Bug family tripartite tricarboxylate transporter substrate binding protein [Beijerinckiaceae bacterium]
MRRLRRIAAAAILTFVTSQASLADDVAQFYSGRQVALIVGADAGGGYDAQGRLMGRHLGRFIPGNPSFVVQNMPGAGSLQAANHLYNVATKDGSVIALLQRGVLSSRFTNPAGARFDLARFNWLGNLSSEAGVVLAWHATPFHTIQDVMKQEMLVGGTGATIDTETTPRLLNALIGTKFKVVTGYRGTGDTTLAMERGELQGMGDWSWSNVKTRRPDYLRDKKVRVLLQVAIERIPDLPDVPMASDFLRNDDDRKVMDLFLAQKAAARPVAAPPDLPADRVNALREAFARMIQDQAFLKDAASQKLDIEPTPAAEIDKVIRLFSTTPDSVGQRLRDSIAPK